MKMKRCFAFILSVLMAVTMALPAERAAASVTKTETIEETQVVSLSEEDIDLPENDELFAAYVDELFFGDYGIATYGEYGSERLTGNELKIYTALKAFIGDVADGKQASTDKTFSLQDDFGLEKTTWTPEELGLESDQILVETEGGKGISAAASEALYEKIGFNYSTILQYLLMDCPLDLYWYDKISGSRQSMSMSYSSLGNEIVSVTVPSIRLWFSVARSYQDTSAADPLHTMNVALAKSAQTAAANAKEIVNTYALYSDYDKLVAYKNAICDLVNYNQDAIADGYIAANGYGNPWQLIWVFDGNSTTNVVCEGYAKAFQYLCDLSEFFDENIRCYTVTGCMGGGTGAGDHMWNIVTMDNKKQYIVDVTNCDDGTIGGVNERSGLFLVGAAGSVADKYTVTIQNDGNQDDDEIVYDYRLNGEGDNGNLARMQELYGDLLQISSGKYKFDYVASGGYETGSNITWTIDAQGFLNIKGTGDMPNAENVADYGKIPWHIYKSANNEKKVEIRRVLVEEGITSVSDWAFAFCNNLEDISLPKSLKKIGAASFAGSNIKTLVLPEGLTNIGGLAFLQCEALEEIEIPKTVVKAGVQEGIEAGAFAGCNKLMGLTVNSENPSYVVENGVLYSNDKTTLHYVLAGKSGEFQVSDGVTRIAGYALMNYNGIKSIVVPEGVTKVGVGAFSEMESLEDVWFSGCPILEEVVQKDQDGNVTVLGTVFDGDTLTVHYPRSKSDQWQSVIDKGFPAELATVTFEAFCADDEHEWEDDYTIDEPATCTTDGRKSKHCKLCGKSGEDAVVIPGEHSYGDWTVIREAACMTDGEEQRVCSVCENVDTRSIAPLGHAWDAEPTIDPAPTCTEDGQQAVHCANCDELKDVTALPATGHAWDAEPTIDPAPTCTEDGQQAIHCANCDELNDVTVLPATGHDMKKTGDYYTCQKCQKTFSDEAGTTEYKPSTPEKPNETGNGNGNGNETGNGSGNGNETGNGIGGVAKEEVRVSQISINAISKQIAAGKKIALSATVFPADVTTPNVITWESSNTKYATVNASGVVTTKKAGKGKSVKITAKATDGSGVTATITLKIMANAVTKVQMIDPIKTAKAGQRIRLKAVAVVNGRKVNNKLKWTSSDESVATVDAKGRVKIAAKPKKKTVTITAMSTDGTNKKAKVKIRIN